mmetsp:Transcript_20530/g.39882  ORF Transcript_20530/g.39882 Transcript_20530/m.39882 type:complete len:110 (+) Transcript_20530:1626-1955(+)
MVLSPDVIMSAFQVLVVEFAFIFFYQLCCGVFFQLGSIWVGFFLPVLVGVFFSLFCSFVIVVAVVICTTLCGGSLHDWASVLVSVLEGCTLRLVLVCCWVFFLRFGVFR